VSARLSVLNISTFTLAFFPGDDEAEVTLDEYNRYILATSIEDTFTIVAQATDVNDQSSETTRLLHVNSSADNTPPEVALSMSPENPAVGDAVTFSLAVSDRIVHDESVWLKIDGEYLQLDENNIPVRYEIIDFFGECWLHDVDERSYIVKRYLAGEVGYLERSKRDPEDQNIGYSITPKGWDY